MLRGRKEGGREERTKGMKEGKEITIHPYFAT